MIPIPVPIPAKMPKNGEGIQIMIPQESESSQHRRKEGWKDEGREPDANQTKMEGARSSPH